VRVLSWNLKHGRAESSAGRDLFEDFAARLSEWEWHVALLQEVPPWWPADLTGRTGAAARHVLTSRNLGLPVRRWLATRWPDIMKSNGGGANAILVRGGEVVDHRTRRLCWWPERRWVQAVHVRDGAFGAGVWVGNLHATAHDAPAAQRDDDLAATTVLTWAGGLPSVVGGDLNLRQLALSGFAHAGGHDVDHVFVHGIAPCSSVEVLERGSLSDHAPVAVELETPR
jgi:endonuclease/exonuclease/phosphatase family metal-dependent hydrolase